MVPWQQKQKRSKCEKTKHHKGYRSQHCGPVNTTSLKDGAATYELCAELYFPRLTFCISRRKGAEPSTPCCKKQSIRHRTHTP